MIAHVIPPLLGGLKVLPTFHIAGQLHRMGCVESDKRTTALTIAVEISCVPHASLDEVAVYGLKLLQMVLPA